MERIYGPYLNRWTQPDTIIPNISNPQDWNRYSYSRNNPIKYIDPSGHSVDCGIGDPYCEAGKINTQKQALDIAQKIKTHNKNSNTTRYWASLSKDEQTILVEAGWNEYEFADYTQQALSRADALHDPAVWIALSFATIRMAPSVVLALGQYLCYEADCSNEIDSIDAVFPKNPGQLMHIFRNATGHLAVDNLVNRDILLKTVSPDNFKTINKNGSLVFTRIIADGTEVWVYVRDGIIQNGGVNQMPFWH